MIFPSTVMISLSHNLKIGNSYNHYLITYLTVFSDLCKPGQGLGLHGWLSVAGPSQSLPPLDGSGLLHSRFLVMDPPLHGLLQFGHEDQLLQLPWTKRKIKKDQHMRSIRTEDEKLNKWMIYEFLPCFYQSTKLFSNFHKISFLSSQLFSFTHHRFMV